VTDQVFASFLNYKLLAPTGVLISP